MYSPAGIVSAYTLPFGHVPVAVWAVLVNGVVQELAHTTAAFWAMRLASACDTCDSAIASQGTTLNGLLSAGGAPFHARPMKVVES